MTDNLPVEEVSATGIRKQASAQKKHIKKYDFGQPKVASKEIMRVLHKIHNLFSHDIERIFSIVLNLKVEVTLEGIEQAISAEFISSMESPSALFLFDIEELDDWTVLQMDPSFCVFLVEHESGGRSTRLGEARSLTRLEERIISRTIAKIFNELTHIWSSYVQMTMKNYVYESNPANIRIISPNIPAIKISFNLKVGKFEVPFRICYPLALLKEQMVNSFDKFNNKEDKETLSSGQYQQFKNEMKQVNVQTKARLGSTNMAIHQLLNLEEGDLIKLDQHIDEPLGVFVNDKLKMFGFPGIKSGKKAVKIFEILNNDNIKLIDHGT